MNKTTADQIIAILQDENLCQAPFTLSVNPQRPEANTATFYVGMSKVETKGKEISEILRRLFP